MANCPKEDARNRNPRGDGATERELICMVLTSAAKPKPVLFGLALGLGAALVLARYIESMLFNTTQLDPLTLGMVSMLFLLAGMASCLVPALGASRVDPMLALREDKTF